jgi:Flp pilus assembly protein TadD
LKCESIDPVYEARVDRKRAQEAEGAVGNPRIDAVQEDGAEIVSAPGPGNLSEAELLAGDLDLAQETASRALELDQSDGFTFSSGLALRALGRIDTARSNFWRSRGATSASLGGVRAMRGGIRGRQNPGRPRRAVRA